MHKVKINKAVYILSDDTTTLLEKNDTVKPF